MSLLRRLLYPLALPYMGMVRLRHLLYDRGIFPSSAGPLPTIAFGNFALGGTGKTPHVDLALRLLANDAPVAVLSRGYGRKGSAIREVSPEDPAELVGDEPRMLKLAHPQVRIFVGADRLAALEHIQRVAPEVSAVLLDDALQHRRLRPALRIALTTWHKPWFADAPLPAGDLRDLPYRGRHADAVIVTKCPALPSPAEQTIWRQRLGLAASTPLFFSSLAYAPPHLVGHNGTIATGPDSAALLFTGIADPAPLLAHARTLFGNVEHRAFPDHHTYSTAELRTLVERTGTFAARDKTLITTEKDLARLGTAIHRAPLLHAPLGVIGVRAEILGNGAPFTELLRTHVPTRTTHS